jgi:hypothetical protein
LGWHSGSNGRPLTCLASARLSSKTPVPPKQTNKKNPQEIIILFIFGAIRVSTQGLILARQVLYHYSVFKFSSVSAFPRARPSP